MPCFIKKKHLPYLKLLAIKGLSSQLRNVLLQQKGLVRCCCECSLNILNGNVKLNDKDKEQLKKYKQVLRQLATKSISLKDKEHILRQKGSGFLPLLLVPALGLLARMFNDG